MFINPDTNEILFRPDEFQCIDGDELNGENVFRDGELVGENPDEFFARVNNHLVAYFCLMHAGSALIYLGFEAVQKKVLARHGANVAAMMLPLVQIGYNLWTWEYLDAMNVCVSRAVYLCFFSLHFGVVWEAIPDDARPQPLLEDVLPPIARGFGALLALGFQRLGIAANDAGLLVLMSVGSLCCVLCHCKLATHAS